MPGGVETESRLRVYLGEALGAYAFPGDHPFGVRRYPAFVRAFEARGLAARCDVGSPRQAKAEEIRLFHTPAYVSRVRLASRLGTGFLDQGDTPAFPGVYEAAATVVGTGLEAARAILAGECSRAFVPIGGLHHARRDAAAGFCVFNDCGVVIEYLLRVRGLGRVAYVDIDAHHGDGLYYGFVDDPAVFIADVHEDGRYLYPGTGSAAECGTGPAAGTKLNLPLAPGARDEAFFEAWARAESFVREADPDFVLFQAGADSLAGDPITHLRFSAAAHAHAAASLRRIAGDCCGGRLLGWGGGGYDLETLAAAWTAVVEAWI